jgi:hypothetical protein
MSRSSIKKLPRDANQRAFEIVRLSTEEEDEPKVEETPAEDTRSEISKYLSAIGRKGGLVGGKARAEKLSAKKRSEIAKKAAKSRWFPKEK